MNRKKQETVYDRIMYVARKKGITERELEIAVGMTKTSLRSWRDSMPAYYLHPIAWELDADAGWILLGEDRPKHRFLCVDPKVQKALDKSPEVQKILDDMIKTHKKQTPEVDSPRRECKVHLPEMKWGRYS